METKNLLMNGLSIEIQIHGMHLMVGCNENQGIYLPTIFNNILCLFSELLYEFETNSAYDCVSHTV